MLSVEAARQQMLNTIPVLPPERRGILNCAGYVLTEGLSATENIPPFDNSAMDGYAVCAADVQNASQENPVVLSVTETIAAGYAPTKQDSNGQAARIMYGCYDALTCRNCRHAGKSTNMHKGKVKLNEGVGESENVRFTGESVKLADFAMGKGKQLRSYQEVSMIAFSQMCRILKRSSETYCATKVSPGA